MRVEEYPAGAPSWVDFMASDQDAAIAFYSNLFGWEVVKSGPDMGNYAMCLKGDQPVAGIGSIPVDQGIPPAWTVYLNVIDADATVASTVAAGGQIYVPQMDVKGDGQFAGRMAIIADPSGAPLGIWEAHDHKGSGVKDEPGSMCWAELLSADPKAAKVFLESVFGFDWSSMPDVDMEYYVASLGGAQVAGLMGKPDQMPAEMPSCWMVYFAVEDCDATAAQALALGATMLQPEPFDTPHGRMALLEDPQGAMFSVISM